MFSFKDNKKLIISIILLGLVALIALYVTRKENYEYPEGSTVNGYPIYLDAQGSHPSDVPPTLELKPGDIAYESIGVGEGINGSYRQTTEW